MIEQRHFDEAAAMVRESGWGDDCSEAFREGLGYAVAWTLAGRPIPTAEQNIKTACPYADRTAEKDAWHSGFQLGKNNTTPPDEWPNAERCPECGGELTPLDETDLDDAWLCDECGFNDPNR